MVSVPPALRDQLQAVEVGSTWVRHDKHWFFIQHDPDAPVASRWQGKQVAQVEDGGDIWWTNWQTDRTRKGVIEKLKATA